MSDTRKAIQRNIRVPDELWGYVLSLAPKGHTRLGDASSVIRNMIENHRENRRNNTP